LPRDARAAYDARVQLPLSGKVIVIIGGTTGLGLSAAKAFIAAGARVVVVGRNPDSVAGAEVVLGGKALAFAGDATHAETAERAIGEAAAAFGGFHGLYHVAGGSGRKFGDGPLHELTEEGSGDEASSASGQGAESGAGAPVEEGESH